MSNAPLILVTNDDGIYAPGITFLAKVAAKFGTPSDTLKAGEYQYPPAFVFNYLLLLKNSLTIEEHSASMIPVITSVLGWRERCLLIKPLCSSRAPITTFEI